MDQATILVVDDTAENIALLVEILRDDYQVKAARNGEQALKIAGLSPPPDLILLDIMMPGIDGYEVCRRIKNDPRTRDLPGECRQADILVAAVGRPEMIKGDWVKISE